MRNVRVRFAPSPTGPLHIGGVRTALYNYLFARKHRGTFILRIEDTDQARYVPGAEDYIIEALDWCGLMPDEGPVQGGSFGPYRQSERKDIYRQFVDQLIEKGHAYYAFDTVEELEAMRSGDNNHVKYDSTTRMRMRNSLTLGIEKNQRLIAEGVPYVVRMRIPEDRKVIFSDRIRGKVIFDAADLDDKVILKADGLPTYHLANVVDDFLMQITHVIRGEEWLSSTAHHVLLYEAFDWLEVMPEFSHLPLILKPSGKGKLSKRDGQKFGFPVFPLPWIDEDPTESFEGFKSVGFDPAALINFLAFLGWNPGTEQEIFSLEELIGAFSLDHIGKSGSRFDYEKALWFNSQYISRQAINDLVRHVQPFMQAAGIRLNDQRLSVIVALMQDRIRTYSDLPAASTFFFHPPRQFDHSTIKKKWNGSIKSHYLSIVDQVEAITIFKSKFLKEVVNTCITGAQLKFGDILPLLRIALCGEAKGPDLFMIMEVIGREDCLKRLKDAVVVFDATS